MMKKEELIELMVIYINNQITNLHYFKKELRKLLQTLVKLLNKITLKDNIIINKLMMF